MAFSPPVISNVSVQVGTPDAAGNILVLVTFTSTVAASGKSLTASVPVVCGATSIAELAAGIAGKTLSIVMPASV